ncbi:MAG TPA: glycosyltransferase family 4 protein [Alphaproteobacteria bacterium]|nr:glycosyltransferase family 4 protein [Alphaproteobacteria bacterium]
MRVAFYAPLKPPDHKVPSGDRRMARLLMAALRAAGHEVVLASRLRSWTDGGDPERQARIRDRGRRIAAALVRRWRDGSGRPDAWFTYHLYHKAPDWLGPPVADALGIPYVVAEASHAAKRALGPWAEGHAAALAAIRRADAVLALSAVDAEGLAGVVAAPDRLVRLPPFLDVAPFAAAGRAEARAKWFDGEVGPWLVAVGMMREGDKLRSYRVLADALRRLADLPWRLALAGDGPARTAVLDGFDPARVRHLGQLSQDDLPGLLAGSDLMVWPAINEAYGMALLEAQAAGLPVVAGASGGVPDIVRHGATGLLTPAGDAAAFAEAVRALLGDAGRRRALGAEAARIAAAEHGFPAAAAGLDAVLRRVTGRVTR